MISQAVPQTNIEFYPLTKERWQDLEALFGARGACGGCWCMWWRVKRSTFEQQKGQANKEQLQAIVASGEIPGLLAYIDGQPVAWCAIAPRETYPALERSRVLKRVDDELTWSITCFFVARPFRRQGITVKLLTAAVAYARAHGARILEGYPVEPRGGKMPDAFAWTGTVSALRRSPAAIGDATYHETF
jgi:GNAT superfamily N-acetyltransferase